MLAEALEDRRLLTTSTAFSDTAWSQTSEDPDPTGPGVHVAYSATSGYGFIDPNAGPYDSGDTFGGGAALLSGLPAHTMARVLVTGDPYGWTPDGQANSARVTAEGKDADVSIQWGPYGPASATTTAATPWFSHDGDVLSVTLADTNPNYGQWIIGWGVEVYQPTVSITGAPSVSEDGGPTTLAVARDLPAGYLGTSAGDDPLASLAVSIAASGTATNGSDYTLSSDASQNVTGVTIPAGAASAPLTVTPTWDNVVEGDEPFALAGSAPGATSAPAKSMTVIDGAQVSVTSLTVTDKTAAAPAGPGNQPYAVTATVLTGNTAMYVMENDGSASLELSAVYSPSLPEAGAKALWQVAGGPGASSGNFGGATNPTVTLSPGGGQRTYTAKVGGDDNNNGTLEPDEVERIMTVYVLKLSLGPPKFNTGVVATQTLENTDLNYAVELSGAPDGAPFAYKDRIRIHYNDNTVMDGESNLPPRTGPTFTLVARTAPVPDSEPDKMTPQEVTIAVIIGGRTFRSAARTVEVYKLWIDYFRDAGTQKPWQVVVGSPIDYKAIGSSDLHDWQWSLGNKWHATGGNAKSGSQMKIPFSDLANVGNSDFGDAYGTVTIKATDGNGDVRTFTSGQLTGTGPKKAKVFFDPGTNLEGGAPSTTKPAAWFVFWMEAIGGEAHVSYDPSVEWGQTDQRVILPSGLANPSAGYITLGDSGHLSFAAPMNWAQQNNDANATRPADGKSGIDLFFSILKHELAHRFIVDWWLTNPAARQNQKSVDDDLDFLPDQYDKPGADGLQHQNAAALPEYQDDPLGLEIADMEWFARQSEDVTGPASADWSKGGKQW